MDYSSSTVLTHEYSPLQQEELILSIEGLQGEYTDSDIKLAIQSLPPSICPSMICYRLEQALRKRLKQMNNTRIDYTDSPFFKFWSIYWINFLVQGLFGLVIILDGPTPYKNIWLGVLWFTLFIGFFFVLSLINAHTRWKREMDFAWLKELEKNSPLVRHFSNLETAKAKKVNEDFYRNFGYVFFFMMFLMLILTVVLVYNMYPNKDYMELTSVVLFFATKFGVTGMLFRQTDPERKRRLTIINSIVISFFFFLFVLSKLWFWCFILSFGVSAVASLTMGYLYYRLMWSVSQEEDQLYQFVGAEEV